MGSVGNIAQTFVVAHGSREEINENAGASRGAQEEREDYESEGHYVVVDENILNGIKERNEENSRDNREAQDKPPVEVIYATVNKNRKPRVYKTI